MLISYGISKMKDLPNKKGPYLLFQQNDQAL